jgi:hypothetical protein
MATTIEHLESIISTAAEIKAAIENGEVKHTSEIESEVAKLDDELDSIQMFLEDGGMN